MAVESLNENSERKVTTVELPAATAWPIVLAFGLTLLVAGLVTSEAVSVLGVIFAVAGAAGWFRDVLPFEAQETLPVEREAPAVTTLRPEVARARPRRGLPRAWLPVEIYPVSAGVKGGLAGSVAMAALATLFGIASHTSIWYPINLLAAGFFPAAVNATTAQLSAFHLPAFLIAVPIHLITSLLVGLLYGAMLPIIPRRPILLGGFVGPILWSGLLHSILGFVNPVMNQRIDWPWFVASQVAFGIVAGVVVSRQERVPTSQPLPIGHRMGMEETGPDRREDQRP
jgi:hypothetical protein